ncbi:molecular chaperone [Salmonella enterica subsp. enterica]|nr:molecular chaperone [Salmonella enterica subsp. enterica serovar Bonn]EBZ5939341.1 molecular chaperone [Salmonella enterica subsp. enterica serovar Muenchen]MLZ41084.1 molecular chaperone [Salmonella enterica subsp. enterica serovar Bonn]
MKTLFRKCIPFLMLSLVSTAAIAGIKIDRTRLIYNEGDNGVVLNVTSLEKQDMLIQSWLTEVDGKKETQQLMVVPPVQQLAAGQTRAVRVLHKTSNLPRDRESVFWLHVQEIPKKDNNQTNTLKLAVKNSLKVFWRPAKVAKEFTNYNALLKKVKTYRTGNTLTIENPTSFYLTVNKIKGGNSKFQIVNKMIPPFGKMDITTTISSIEYIVFIDDFGGFPEKKI